MDPFLCWDVQKISHFRLYVWDQHFSVRTHNFVLKRSTVGLIMHKNSIRYENIRFWGIFRHRRGQKIFDSVSSRYNGCFWPGGIVSIAGIWAEGGGSRLQGFRPTSGLCILASQDGWNQTNDQWNSWMVRYRKKWWK